VSSYRPVVLISGSTKGIGEAIAIRFIDDGYIVLQNSRNPLPPNEVIGDKHYVADVTLLSECEKMVRWAINDYGKIDILVLNVGNGKDISKEVSMHDRLDHFMKWNFYSATNLVSASLEALKESKGSVVAVSSICGESPASYAPLEYGVAKASLNSYIKAMAHRFAIHKIRFNAVAPGNVLFVGSTWEEKLINNQDETRSYIDRNVPLKNFIAAEEIANAVHFLGSKTNLNTTGTILNVDGGQSL
jgi:3-oxoacyl-[acyl-carrier protein] reductase